MSTVSKPCTSSELQLYRVLQRANLLSYYDTFIEQGGDDVLQLCEAGEDEFLEIMRLVGMSGKPLHVRRLQKALQDWVLNPEQFSYSSLDTHSGSSSYSCCSCCCHGCPATIGDRSAAAAQRAAAVPAPAAVSNAATEAPASLASAAATASVARACTVARAPPATGSILALSRLTAGGGCSGCRSGCHCAAERQQQPPAMPLPLLKSAQQAELSPLQGSCILSTPQQQQQQQQPLQLRQQPATSAMTVVKSESSSQQQQQLVSSSCAASPLPSTQPLPPLASFVSLTDGGGDCAAGGGVGCSGATDSRVQLLTTSCTAAAVAAVRSSLGSAVGRSLAVDAVASNWLCASPPKSPQPTAAACSPGDSGWQKQLTPQPLQQQQQQSVHAVDSDDLDQDQCSSQSSEDGSSSGALSVGSSAALLAASASGSLAAAQVEAIREAALVVCRTLPPTEVKQLNLKKPMNRAIEALMQSGVNTTEQVEELRSYSAIYGRFDSKRRSNKPVSLHEMSVNEAAAQLCLLRPALLTRRDELFPLARMVVRESGYSYSKGHSRALTAASSSERATAEESASGCSTPSKRPRRSEPSAMAASGDQSLTASSDSCELPAAPPRLEARLTEIDQQLKRLAALQAKLTSHLHDVRSGCDGDAAAAADCLQLELESLSSQQIHLLSEQMDLLQQERQQQQRQQDQQQHRDDEEAAATAGYHMVGCGGSGSVYSDAPAAAAATCSGDRSICSNGSGRLPGGVPSASTRRAAQRQFVRESLFDEGLRIAKQYGLSDLAAELEDMKEETARSRQATQQQQQRESSRIT